MNIIEKLGITPGPWKACNPEHPMEDYFITHTFKWNTKNIEGTLIDSVGGKANAWLIAAAPEMLEALIETALYLDGEGHVVGVIELCIEVIEEATGRAWEEIKELINE